MPRTKKNRQARHELGELVSSATGVLTVGGGRAMLMTESAFSFLQQVIAEQMPEFMAYGFYEMGFRAGMDLADSAGQAADSPEAAFRNFVETYRQGGYGDLEVVEFDLREARAVLHGRRLLESSAAARSGIFRSPRAVDHYSRGTFAGLFSRILGKEVVCEELCCEFRGDPYCEFIVLPFGGLLGNGG